MTGDVVCVLRPASFRIDVLGPATVYTFYDRWLRLPAIVRIDVRGPADCTYESVDIAPLNQQCNVMRVAPGRAREKSKVMQFEMTSAGQDACIRWNAGTSALDTGRESWHRQAKPLTLTAASQLSCHGARWNSCTWPTGTIKSRSTDITLCPRPCRRCSHVSNVVLKPTCRSPVHQCVSKRCARLSVYPSSVGTSSLEINVMIFSVAVLVTSSCEGSAAISTVTPGHCHTGHRNTKS